LIIQIKQILQQKPLVLSKVSNPSNYPLVSAWNYRALQVYLPLNVFMLWESVAQASHRRRRNPSGIAQAQEPQTLS
jgi:hypothetical protein